MEYELNEISAAASFLLDEAAAEKVWCFVGEMGAGKTTLIKEICKKLGVQTSLSSPTFSIVNAYELPGELEVFHFDFYRIEDSAEIVQLGVEEYFDSGAYCFIEWPDRVIDFLPDAYVKISIKLVSNNRRKLTISHV
jgi:tRNA threonylcarbamoyladenosine biosynthesis protein TsaE